MKKILSESEKKAILVSKEKNIVESFKKNFDRIKRLDENDYGDEDYEQASREVEYGVNPYNQELDEARPRHRSNNFSVQINIQELILDVNVDVEAEEPDVNYGGGVSVNSIEVGGVDVSSFIGEMGWMELVSEKAGEAVSTRMASQADDRSYDTDDY